MSDAEFLGFHVPPITHTVSDIDFGSLFARQLPGRLAILVLAAFWIICLIVAYFKKDASRVTAVSSLLCILTALGLVFIVRVMLSPVDVRQATLQLVVASQAVDVLALCVLWLLWAVILFVASDSLGGALFSMPIACCSLLGAFYLVQMASRAVPLIELLLLLLILILPAMAVSIQLAGTRASEDLYRALARRSGGGHVSGLGTMVAVVRLVSAVGGIASHHDQHTDAEAFAKWSSVIAQQAAHLANEAVRLMNRLYPRFAASTAGPPPRNGLTGTWAGHNARDEKIFALFLVLLEEGTKIGGVAVLFDGTTAVRYQLHGERLLTTVSLALEEMTEQLPACKLEGTYHSAIEQLDLAGSVALSPDSVVPLAVRLARGGVESLAAQFFSSQED